MSSGSCLDAALLRRYDVTGPRYTSYPTAPQFREDFGEEQLRRWAGRSNVQATPHPLSIYAHIPYCHSPCFYCGCNRRISRNSDDGDHYVERLLHEIRLVAPMFDARREVIQLHLGGGTPNFLRLPSSPACWQALRVVFVSPAPPTATSPSSSIRAWCATAISRHWHSSASTA